jgi:hypothetical protein
VREELIAGRSIGIHPFLSLDSDQEMGLCIYHEFGGSFISLVDFINESKIDMDKVARFKYAAAFEVIAKQLRAGE